MKRYHDVGFYPAPGWIESVSVHDVNAALASLDLTDAGATARSIARSPLDALVDADGRLSRAAPRDVLSEPLLLQVVDAVDVAACSKDRLAETHDTFAAKLAQPLLPEAVPQGGGVSSAAPRTHKRLLRIEAVDGKRSVTVIEAEPCPTLAGICVGVKFTLLRYRVRCGALVPTPGQVKVHHSALVAKRTQRVNDTPERQQRPHQLRSWLLDRRAAGFMAPRTGAELESRLGPLHDGDDGGDHAAVAPASSIPGNTRAPPSAPSTTLPAQLRSAPPSTIAITAATSANFAATAPASSVPPVAWPATSNGSGGSNSHAPSSGGVTAGTSAAVVTRPARTLFMPASSAQAAPPAAGSTSLSPPTPAHPPAAQPSGGFSERITAAPEDQYSMSTTLPPPLGSPRPGTEGFLQDVLLPGYTAPVTIFGRILAVGRPLGRWTGKFRLAVLMKDARSGFATLVDMGERWIVDALGFGVDRGAVGNATACQADIARRPEWVERWRRLEVRLARLGEASMQAESGWRMTIAAPVGYDAESTTPDELIERLAASNLVETNVALPTVMWLAPEA